VQVCCFDIRQTDGKANFRDEYCNRTKGWFYY